MHKFVQNLGIMFSLLGLHACSTVPGKVSKLNPVVGAWYVKDTDAPFPYHMYVFNGDGTMQQANPDAGDPHASDSDGKGIWVTDGDRVRGKWVEVTADRATHKFTGRVEITYEFSVSGDLFVGTSSARSYDANDILTAGPTAPGPFGGKRVTYP
jgi:hypothetical protein